MSARRMIVIFCFLCILPRSASSRNGPRTAIVMAQNQANECRSGVEYTGLGCFTLDPPFTNTNWLPQSPSSINLRFLLYSRNSFSTPDILSAENRSSLIASHFNPRFPTKFIVHGFLQYAGMDFLANMTNALLNKASMNVIVVSWGDGAGFPYARAVANTRVVGAAIAHLITALMQVTGITAQQVHIIGHSLGGHVAGYAGAVVPNLGRITGLDPAQPGFSGYDTTVRLDKTDATFVDIIHSDALPYDTVRGYGVIEPVGHIDFYPNGGHHQPGCHEDGSVLDFLEDAVSNGMTIAEVSLSCSHERSTELFTSSVILSSTSSSCTFQAFPCPTEDNFLRGECLNCGNRPCPIMGLDAENSFGARGVFYLNTTGSSPFCGHHYFVALTLDPNMTDVDGIVRIRLRGTTGRQLIWKLVKQGRLSGGDRISSLFVDDTNIGEVNEVDVKFLSRSNYFFRRSSLIVKKLDVDNVMRFPRKYFCRSSVTVQDGHEVTLTSGTYMELECS